MDFLSNEPASTVWPRSELRNWQSQPVTSESDSWDAWRGWAHKSRWLSGDLEIQLFDLTTERSLEDKNEHGNYLTKAM